MTNEQAKKMLKAKLECLKRDTSGTDFDCNNRNCDDCSLCYEQGNMGEQKEALDMAIKALEKEPKTEQRCKWVRYDYRTICPQNHDIDNPYWRIPEKRMEVLKYCPYCGKEIEVEE